MGDAVPSTYTGTTLIMNGIVTDGRSNIIGGEWDPLGVANYSQHMFGESDVLVDSGGKIWFFLSSADDGGSIDNVIELVNYTPTSAQIEFINVTDDNSQVDIAVPNLILSSDNRFDALTYNGNLMINLSGINNNNLYCLTHGAANEQTANFQNGPDCSDPPVDPPVDPILEEVPGAPEAGKYIAKHGLIFAGGTVPALAWFVRKKLRI